MSEIEIITDGGSRRHWSASEKMRIVEETLEDGTGISVAVRQNGVALNLLYRWRRLMLDGVAVTVSEDNDVTSNRAVRQMEERIRELKGQGSAERAIPERNRGHLPKHLPHVERVIEPETTLCPCGCGEVVRISEDVSERLDVVPAQLRVLIARRPK